MTDYTKLIEALRCCIPYPPEKCVGCTYNIGNNECAVRRMMLDAADAIEALQADTAELESCGRTLTEQRDYWKDKAEKIEPKRGEWILTNDEIETIRIHMNAIKEQLCNQYRHHEAEAYQTIVDKLAKMEVQE